MKYKSEICNRKSKIKEFVISFSNCKINLGLHIIGKRNDGFHDLETVFFPLQILDAIEVVQQEYFQFSNTGIKIEGNPEENLCFKAYQLIKKDLPDLPPVKMHLHKTILPGSGLGGGSSNGAFILKLLNQKFNLSLSTEKLLGYALQLGSDCPFFIINKPCIATGRGEVLKPITIDLSSYKFIVVNPRIHVSTASAFSQIEPAIPLKSIVKIIQQPITTWKQELKNDFEEPVFLQHPEIKKIKEDLYKEGAIYASMTGSGSTVYGIFEKEKNLKIDFPADYFVKELC